MGYMGLAQYGDSDKAADLYSNAVDAMLKVLNKGIKAVENEVNTSGPENVALIIESGLLDGIPEYHFEEFNFKAIIKGLEHNIKESGSSKKKVWYVEESRIEHHEAYRRMLRNVRQFMKNKGIK